MYVHKSVLEMLQRYNNRLGIRYNPNWKSLDERFLIFEKFNSLFPLVEDLDLHRAGIGEFGIGYTNQATEPDIRLIQRLSRQFMQKLPDTKIWLRDGYYKHQEHYGEMARDWAKDVGSWHFKRKYSQYNLTSAPNVDPTAKIKKMQDDLGRDLIG